MIASRNMNYTTLDDVKDIPSSIVWTQTMESITLEIDIVSYKTRKKKKRGVTNDILESC